MQTVTYRFLLISAFVFSICSLSNAQEKPQKKKKKKTPPPFQWINELKQDYPRLKHATFKSPSLNVDVGYCIYLPEEYDQEASKDKRFPVVYYLHGGRPGSETKSVKLVEFIHKAQTDNVIPPTIYVFVNGGPVSHYDMPNDPKAQGATVFIKELIPHIDRTYRTIADRSGRAIEGFSQGGRGTARLMFRYPELFCSAAPGGGGHASEKHISENDGYENPNLRFAPGDNTWDLAREYAKHPKPPLRILVYVGNKGFNYENNLEWMQHLKSLDIPFDHIIIDDAPHSPVIIYRKRGDDIMKFHAESFRLAQGKK